MAKRLQRQTRTDGGCRKAIHGQDPSMNIPVLPVPRGNASAQPVRSEVPPPEAVQETLLGLKRKNPAHPQPEAGNTMFWKDVRMAVI